MGTYRQSIPQADTLMGSMRSMGYSFEAAIADIIDNGISANCSVVKLFFPSEPIDDLVVGILDDGEGMSAGVLFEAMRYGSRDSELERNANDLGRFGLGMKSASLSQCRILTVVSLQEEKISSYSWDYNYIQNRKEWVVKELSQNEIKASGHCTLCYRCVNQCSSKAITILGTQVVSQYSVYDFQQNKRN